MKVHLPNLGGMGFQGNPLANLSNSHPGESFGESLRRNRIGATGLRASERKSASERVSEREGFQRGFERFSEAFRGFPCPSFPGFFGIPCFFFFAGEEFLVFSSVFSLLFQGF